MTKEGQSNGMLVSAGGEQDILASAAKGPVIEMKGSEALSKQIGAISSGPFEISPESFAAPQSANGPPSAVVENAMERGRAVLPLSAIVGIGCGIFVVLVGLALLLFR